MATAKTEPTGTPITTSATPVAHAASPAAVAVPTEVLDTVTMSDIAKATFRIKYVTASTFQYRSHQHHFQHKHKHQHQHEHHLNNLKHPTKQG
jgi:hypothetical protein